MITKSEVTVEQRLSVYTCTRCDYRGANHEGAAQHYAMNHLPQRVLPKAPMEAGDGWFMSRVTWCATAEDHALLCAGNARDTEWNGPAWYASLWRTRREDGEQVTTIRVTALVVLVAEAEKRAAAARKVSRDLYRLATAASQPSEDTP